MEEHPADFPTVLNRVIQIMVEDGKLERADRTTNSKRLKRAWAARHMRRRDLPTLAGILRGCWDKK
jgi:hypothetical protein